MKMPSDENGESTSSRGNTTASALVPLDLGSLQAFDPQGDPHGTSQRRKRWKRAFNLYLAGKGVTVDAQRRAVLLHVAGLDVQEIYYMLVSDEEEKDYNATMQVLDGISAELNGGVADHAADIPTELHGDVTDDTADASGVETTHGHNSPKRQSPAPSRPQRAMKMPVRFKDFVLSK